MVVAGAPEGPRTAGDWRPLVKARWITPITERITEMAITKRISLARKANMEARVPRLFLLLVIGRGVGVVECGAYAAAERSDQFFGGRSERAIRLQLQILLQSLDGAGRSDDFAARVRRGFGCQIQ